MVAGDAPAKAGPEDLRGQLDRWTAAGLISAEQAERILTAEGASALPERDGRVSLVAEGLGYVGGVLVLVAAGTIAGRYWTELGDAGQLALVFGASVLLLAVGALLPTRLGAAGSRLRSVSWLIGLVLFGTGFALLADDLELPGDTAALITGAASALLALPLWWRQRSILQQAGVLAALALTVGAAAAHLPYDGEEVAGIAIWGLGLAWVLLGWSEVITPWLAASILGGVPVLIGASLTLGTDWGIWAMVGFGALLIVAGMFVHDLVLLAVGSVAVLIAVPVLLDRFFPDTLAAPLGVLIVGGLLVAAGVVTARRRRQEPTTAETRWERGSRRLATPAAAGAAVLAGIVTVLLGVVGG